MLFLGKNTKKKLPVDYHRKRLENPFFKRKEKITLFSGLKAKLIAGTLLIVFGLSGWFLFFSPVWMVKNISINATDTIKDEIKNIVSDQMKEKKILIFQPQKNLLFFNKENLYKTLKNKYRFQQIKVGKKWPDKLEITVTEKTLACVWSEANHYYYVDADGYVMGEVNPLDIQEKTCPLIANESYDSINDSRIGVNPSIIGFATRIFQELPGKSLGIEIDRFITDQDMDTLKLQTSDGQKISFDVKGDADKQLEKLATLKTQKLKDDFKNKKMIDLRFGDKVYYQ
jgi:cell division septal protein FtsQ